MDRHTRTHIPRPILEHSVDYSTYGVHDPAAALLNFDDRISTSTQAGDGTARHISHFGMNRGIYIVSLPPQQLPSIDARHGRVGAGNKAPFNTSSTGDER